jgi:hypothetical protein
MYTWCASFWNFQSIEFVEGEGIPAGGNYYVKLAPGRRGFKV